MSASVSCPHKSGSDVMLEYISPEKCLVALDAMQVIDRFSDAKNLLSFPDFLALCDSSVYLLSDAKLH